jgi:hypothetical protein
MWLASQLLSPLGLMLNTMIVPPGHEADDQDSTMHVHMHSPFPAQMSST